MERLHLEFVARCEDAEPYRGLLLHFIQLARTHDVTICTSEDLERQGASTYAYNWKTGGDRYVYWFIGRARDTTKVLGAVAASNLSHEMGHVLQHADDLHPPDELAAEPAPWEADAWLRSWRNVEASGVVVPASFGQAFEQERARGVGSYASARAVYLRQLAAREAARSAT